MAVPSRRALLGVAAGLALVAAALFAVVTASDDDGAAISAGDKDRSQRSASTEPAGDSTTTSGVTTSSAATSSTTVGAVASTSTSSPPTNATTTTSMPLVLANDLIAFGLYGGNCDADGTCGLYVLDPEGGEPQKIYDGAVNSPSWSPDHSQIAFTTRDGLVVADPDGAALRVLVAHGGDDDFISSPLWSRDGRRIAYTARGRADDPSDTFIIDARGGAPEVLLSTPGHDLFFGWAEDGGSAVISHGHEHLLLYDFGTGRERLLWSGDGTTPMGDDTGDFKQSRGQTSVSQGGLSIVRTFCAEDRHCHIFAKDFESNGPVVDLSGITTAPLVDTQGSFSPGDDRIAFVRATGPDLLDTRIHIVDVSTRTMRPVIGGDMYHPELDW